MKSLTEKELIDLMAEWIEKRFAETKREIIIKANTRDFVIVPYERKIYDKE